MPVNFCFFAFVFFGGSNRKVGSIPIIIGNPPTGLHLVCKITTHASKRKFFVDAYGMNMYLWYMEKGLKKLARGPLHSLKTLNFFLLCKWDHWESRKEFPNPMFIIHPWSQPSTPIERLSKKLTWIQASSMDFTVRGLKSGKAQPTFAFLIKMALSLFCIACKRVLPFPTQY